jgi:hypothetical protein
MQRKANKNILLSNIMIEMKIQTKLYINQYIIKLYIIIVKSYIDSDI